MHSSPSCCVCVSHLCDVPLGRVRRHGDGPAAGLAPVGAHQEHAKGQRPVAHSKTDEQGEVEDQIILGEAKALDDCFAVREAGLDPRAGEVVYPVPLVHHQQLVAQAEPRQVLEGLQRPRR